MSSVVIAIVMLILTALIVKFFPFILMAISFAAIGLGISQGCK